MKKDVYNLTNPQKNIWNTELFFRGTNVNNVCGSSLIKEIIDFNLLKEAVTLFIKQNDCFQTKFLLDENNSPMQFFADFEPFEVEIVDVDDLDGLYALEQKMARKKYNLFNDKLFDIKLARFPNGYGAVVLSVHHIISDSWSSGLTIQEILKNYRALKNHSKYVPTTSSYKEYILAEQNYKESKKFLSDKEFWANYLKDLPEIITLPSWDKSQKPISSQGKRKTYFMDSEFMKKINNFCQIHKISAYSFLMSAISVFIGLSTNTFDFILGTPILNRTNFKEKNTLGMFVTTVPFRVTFDPFNTSFLDFAKKTSIDLISILRHQRYSYAGIVEDLRQKNHNTPNLYNISVSYQITKALEKDIGDYDTHWAFNNNSLNDVNIHMSDLNDTGNLIFEYDYVSNKYTNKEIDFLHNAIIFIIEQIVENPSIKFNDFELLPKEEKNQILNKFNNRALDCPDVSVVELFENQVKAFPNKTALVYDNMRFSYSDLNKSANKLARYLQTSGIGKNDIVGVLMDKTDWFIISILAIQKAGAAYLPIHPDYPEDRVSYILSDSNAKMLLTDGLSTFAVPTIHPDEVYLDYYEDFNLPLSIESNNLCYVIYTSGSTGNPKGVMLTHKNLVNFIYNFNDCFKNPFSSKDVCLSLTNISFDVSVCEIYMPLCFGASLVLYPENTLTDIKMLVDLIENEHISFLYLPPNVLEDVYRFISITNKKFNVSKMLVGVEAIKTGTLNNFIKLNPKIEIVNGYGPTEATICSTFYPYSLQEKDAEIVPIGFPLKNNNIFVLNSLNQLLPIGYPGEIAITGDNVSLGYLSHPELTTQAFVQISALSDRPIYKTGDIGYYTKNGYLEFVGRLDSQIKFKGYRIELNEINKAIINVPGVSNCITIIKEVNGIKSICSYYTTSISKLPQELLRENIANNLPYYMMPSHLVALDEFPVTQNGKIDRKNLPEIEYTTTSSNLPLTATQEKLVSILSKLTGIENLSITDNFFDIGIDSLSAIKFTLEIYYAFNKNITIKEIFKFNTIEKLANFLDSSKEAEDSFKITKLNGINEYKLSYSQKSIYYACQVTNKDSLVYNVSGGILINEVLDFDKIQSAFVKLVKLNPAFRTYFKLVDNEPMQFVLNDVDFKVDFSDEKLEDIEIQEVINRFPKPFDLRNCPLLRVKVIYTILGKTLILIDSHHIVLDGTSLNILINDFCTLYEGNSLEKSDINYIDYTNWEQNFINSDFGKQMENYWTNKLDSNDLPVLNLPYDKNVAADSDFVGITEIFKLPKDIINGISNLAKRYEVSPYMLYLAGFYLLLYKYTSQEDLVIGTPIANRFSDDLKDVIGMFVNNLILKTHINSELSLLEFLNDLKHDVLEDISNGAYPYQLLLEKLQIKTPFDVMFVYQDFDKQVANLLPAMLNISKFNLTFQLIPQSSMVCIEYKTNLFESSTIHNLFESYKNLLQNMINDFDCKISNISTLSNDERDKILYDFNNPNTSCDYPLSSRIIDLISENIIKYPERTAIVFENEKLTYADLIEKINIFVDFISSFGVGNNDVVSICLPRGLDLIICILAVLKLDGTYLLIDDNFPKTRIEYMLNNSKSKYLITSKTLCNEKQIDFKNIIDISASTGSSNAIKNAFHVEDAFIHKRFNTILNENPNFAILYTSGSTGNPKGVLLKQSSMINVIYDFAEHMELNDCNSVLGIASVSFDMFAVELFSSLVLGKTLYLANFEEQRNVSKLGNIIKQNNVEFIVTTPSRIELLISGKENYLKNVKVIQLGGEVFTKNLYNRLCDVTSAHLYNGYGPTEATACSSNKLVSSADDITIGKPISNCQIYICDKNMNLCSVGMQGEICIAGQGISAGYLYNEEATSKSFVKNPFGNGFLYKTGDLGKYSKNGDIIYIGRNDFQVKIHGLRIELSEIENKIYELPGIVKCSVIYKHDPNISYIVAFYTCKYDISPQYIKDILYDILPQYMVPNYIIKLDDFPVTSNGKIDRNVLLDYPIDINQTSTYVEPENDFQKLCCDIWSKLLNTKIGIDDNFFDMGADSLLAIKFKTELLAHDINIDYSDIFKYKTVRTLSKLNKVNTATSLEEYEYSKINNLLQNSYKNIEVTSNSSNNVLLLGSTGFVGMHIIDSFIKNDNGKIYCIVREKNDYESAKSRFLKLIHFYFGDSLDRYIDDRIIILSGDITKEFFGLSLPIYNSLGEQTSCVINAAANVKHFGNLENFKNINIIALDYMIKFCLTFDKRLIHLSSLSISGNTALDCATSVHTDKQKKIFSEQNLYIGQQLDNVYTRSKFEAEKLILDNIIANNLDAQILRLGNITSRYSDGKFQFNFENNAFVNKLKSFIDLSAIPDYLLNDYLEFTPVDLCADAIVAILQNKYSNVYIYHIYDYHHVFIKDFVNIFKNLDINLNVLSDNDFRKLIYTALEKNNESLFGIINDFDNNKKLNYVQNSIVKSDLSLDLLRDIGFEWKNIDFEYFEKYVSYLRKINYIK